MTNQRGTPKLSLTALALIGGLTLAACSSGSSGVRLQSIDPPASASTSATLAPITPTTPGLPSSGSVSASHSSSASTGESSSNPTQPSTVSVRPSKTATTGGTVSGTTSSASNPWPASFTAAQQADARSALAAFNGFVKVSTAAELNPAGKNWTKEIRKYAADPTATSTLDALASLVTAKVHATSTEMYRSVTVLSATDKPNKKVTIQACVDGSAGKLADSSGKPIAVHLPAHPSVLLTYNVYLYDAKYGGWLVSETIVPKPVKPC